MRNVGDKIEYLAAILFVVGLAVGGIWLAISLVQYLPNTGNALKAAAGLAGMAESASLLVLSVITYFVLTGFGHLVNNSDKLIEDQNRNFRDLQKTLESMKDKK